MSLRKKLLITIGLILLCTQFISILWVWHESQEQITILVDATLQHEIRDTQIQHEIRETIAALLLPAFVMILLALALTFFAITRITKPLHELSLTLASRTPENLHPLKIDQASHEVKSMIQQLNALFERITHSVDNEKRFTADIAHELRTPLAGLRLNLELMARETQAAYPLIERIDQMNNAIEQLLQLARASQAFAEGQVAVIDFTADVISPMQLFLTEIAYPIPVVWQVPEHTPMRGNADLLFLMLRNLLDNVRLHASQTPNVIVRVSSSAESTIIELIDQGAGVTEEALEKLTKRFIRMDQSIQGYGLGLNIVARIAQIHQATLFFQNNQQRAGLHITISFPRV